MRINWRRSLRSAATLAISTLVASALTATSFAATTPSPEPTGESGSQSEQLYLVTLTGAGVSAQTNPWARTEARLRITATQQATLELVPGRQPVYRWSDALNGYAIRLTAPEADLLAADPGVAQVEPDEIRKLSSLPGNTTATVQRPHLARGGAGQVIGLIDSGIWPEGPLFGNPRTSKAPRFRGQCAQASVNWESDWCNDKVAGASWFVDGFGADRIASAATLSPVDDIGHGTKVASIAAGSEGVAIRTPTGNLGDFRGVAPRAQLASYKACWSAPNPAEDGCSTADLVTAVDQATADRVDVLNLSVEGGPAGPQIDTLDRALLGAAEADIVVVAAAGNSGAAAFAGHAVPWVTTVGGTSGPRPIGAVNTRSGPQVRGTMTARAATKRARIVLAARVGRPGTPTRDAARCLPGALDAGQVAGKIVTCLRGGIGRIDKSATVAQAGGIGMVLVNARPGRIGIDMHSVPTVHLGVAAGTRLTDWLARHPRAKARLAPTGQDLSSPSVPAFSAAGDPASDLVKPDLVAPALGVVAGTRARGNGARFDYLTGTSAASAEVAGLAAALRALHPDWPAADIRSALTGSSRPVAGGSLRHGAGQAAAEAATRARLVVAPSASDYRRYADGQLRAGALNTASIMMRGQRVATRTLTNRGQRARYYSSSARGFTAHRVTVRPAAIRLAPGESATFTVRINGPRLARTDQGTILWRGGDGTQLRIPMVVSR